MKNVNVKTVNGFVVYTDDLPLKDVQKIMLWRTNRYDVRYNQRSTQDRRKKVDVIRIVYVDASGTEFWKTFEFPRGTDTLKMLGFPPMRNTNQVITEYKYKGLE